MEVIVIESDAFYALVEKVASRIIGELSSKSNPSDNGKDIYMPETEVMETFGITSKSHFIQFRAKKQLPCSKVGVKYLYKRSDIQKYIEKNRI